MLVCLYTFFYNLFPNEIVLIFICCPMSFFCGLVNFCDFYAKCWESGTFFGAGSLALFRTGVCLFVYGVLFETV